MVLIEEKKPVIIVSNGKQRIKARGLGNRFTLEDRMWKLYNFTTRARNTLLKVEKIMKDERR